jgi:cysteinyl-tRNA synthetase
MSIYLYNTLTRKKELFIPYKAGEANIYVCGVTVYDYCHIGHARAYVVFDTIRRYFEHKDYKVTYIQNFTDIDDKIIARANDQGIDYKDLTAKFITAYSEDMQKLNITKASKYPRATNYIDAMQEIIQKLIEKGYAYTNNGDVYFSVNACKDYGKLSKKVLDDLLVGIRVDVSEQKNSPLDFVLWKKAKPGEPSWDSPWGKGRPGWHIECSAMVFKEFGHSIDIHGGGEDLVFPHHENEIAQSESCSGKPFAKYWIHNGFVNIKNEKMSKSKKNFFTLREVLKDFSGETIRFFLQKIHYRSPLNFSFEGLQEAEQALKRLHTTLENIDQKNILEATDEVKSDFENMEKKFYKAMDDDFNSAEAIGVLFEINKLINKTGFGRKLLMKLGQIIGLFFQNSSEDNLPEEALSLIKARVEAKQNKDYLKSDEIRNLLINKYKILVEDTKEGPRWKRV